MVQQNFLQQWKYSLSAPSNMVVTSHVARVGFTKGTDKERSSSSLKGHAHILPFENRKNAGFFLQKNSRTKICRQLLELQGPPEALS